MFRLISLIILLVLPCFSKAQSQYILFSLEITGSYEFTTAELQSNFTTRIGERFIDSVFEQDIHSILLRYEDKGFLLTQVSIERVTAQDSLLTIVLHISEGRRSKISRITVSGLTSTDTNVVSRELLFAAGGTYNRKSIDDAAVRLSRLGIFSSVSDVSYELLPDSTVALSLNVTESRSTMLDGLLGYVPPQRDDETGYINGFAYLSFRNIGGTSRKASLDYRRESSDVQQLGVSYSEPWVFGLPLELGAAFMNRDQDSLYTRTDFSVNASFAFTSYTSVTGELLYSGITTGKTQTIPNADNFSSTIGFQFDTRNNLSAPTRGIVLRLSSGVTSKYVAASSDDSVEQTTATLTTLSLGGAAYMRVMRSSLIAVAAVNIKNIIAGLGGDSGNISIVDKFIIGGTNSLRGFRESEFLTSRYCVGTAELRLMLSTATYIGIFTDVGWFDDIHYGTGISLQFEVPFGIMKTSIAVPDGAFGEAKVHFGLAASF